MVDTDRRYLFDVAMGEALDRATIGTAAGAPPVADGDRHRHERPAATTAGGDIGCGGHCTVMAAPLS